MNENISIKHLIGISIPAFCALCMDLDFPESKVEKSMYFLYNLFASFGPHSIAQIFLFFAVFMFFRYASRYVGPSDFRKATTIIPSLLFSFFMVFGYSFYKCDSWNLVMTIKHGQPIKIVLVFVGYYLLFTRVTTLIYFAMDHLAEEEKTRNDVNTESHLFQVISTHPFLVTFLSILILYIPYTIIFAPGFFMGDTVSQICQAFNELKFSMSYMTEEQLLSPTTFINQHHPVAHTMLVHVCLVLGDKVFNSFNIGMFIYCIIQELFLIAMISYSTSVLIRVTNRRRWYLIAVTGFIFIHPVIHNYMFLITKDIIYTGFFLLLMIQLFLIMRGDRRRSVFILMLLGCIGMILFRNEAKYILAAGLGLSALACREIRKPAAVGACFVLVFSMMLGTFFTMMDYTPGSTREMLSVPFQQTARYVHYHSDEVTDSEREAIDSVLDYSTIGDNYNPNQSDIVKGTYKENATKDDLIRYFKVWRQMLLKHPGCYIQATMNNYYQYFYPNAIHLERYGYIWSEQMMETTNSYIHPLDQQFYYPERFSEMRSRIDELNFDLMTLPGIGHLMSPALAVWMMLLLLFYSIRNNNKKVLALCTTPLMILAISLLGPCNGSYGRYTYPIIVLIPFIIPMVFDLESRRQE